MVNIGTNKIGEFPLLLAPMEDVSDPPFRAVCKENGADLMYTEFISAEGLIRDAFKSRQKLDIYDYERPIGIQIFGEKIESMREAAAIAEEAEPELEKLGELLRRWSSNPGDQASLTDLRRCSHTLKRSGPMVV